MAYTADVNKIDKIIKKSKTPNADLERILRQELLNREDVLKFIVNKINNRECPLLHYLTTTGNLSQLSELIDNGAYPDITDSKGNFPAHVAIVKEQYDILEYLLERDIKDTSTDCPIAEAQTQAKFTPLQLAEYYDDARAIELLQRGTRAFWRARQIASPPNVKQNVSPPPLSQKTANLRQIERWLNKLKDMRITEEQQRDIFNQVIRRLTDKQYTNRDEVIETIVSHINNENGNFLHYVAAYGDIELFTELCDEKINIDNEDALGNHPIHIALERKQHAILKQILVSDIESSHDLLPESEIRNNAGLNAFDIAMKKNDKLAVWLLQKYTAEFWESRKIQPQPGHSSTVYTGSRAQTPLPNDGPGAASPEWHDAVCDLPRFKWLIDSTGQLQWKNFDEITNVEGNVSNKRWGSCSLITPDTLITAGHCFDKLPTSSKRDWYVRYTDNNTAIEPPNLVDYMVVNLNYQNPFCDPTATYRVEPEKYVVKCPIASLEEHRNGELDYAIIKLVHPVDVERFSTLRVSANVPAVGESVAVAQHPDGLPKKIATGKVTRVSSPRLFYNASTDGGSSGGAVANIAEKTLVAVHTNGVDPDLGIKYGNSGVTIKAIAKTSPIIGGLLKQQAVDAAFNPEMLRPYAPPRFGSRRY